MQQPDATAPPANPVVADDSHQAVTQIDYASMYVYEAPVRVWHWLNAVSVTVLVITGYLISEPLPSTNGEASEWYVLGYIRFAHFAAAYVFTLGLAFRLWWGLVGNAYARQIFYLPVWRRRWVHDLLYQIRWQTFLERKSLRYLGHNPVAHVAMTVMYLTPGAFMIITGFAMYSEATGRESWEHYAFGWLVELWNNTQDLHTWHRLCMWIIVNFVILHIYAAVREDIMSGQSVISTMFNGERLFKK